VGFFIITSHGIPDAVIERAWTDVRAFFDLPSDFKEQSVKMDDS
jgi:isopenicillin N synthase-like dioxygenase